MSTLQKRIRTARDISDAAGQNNYKPIVEISYRDNAITPRVWATWLFARVSPFSS